MTFQHVWDKHVGFVCAKVSRALGFLKYAEKLLPQETLSHNYRGIVELYFSYCSSVWGSSGQWRTFRVRKVFSEYPGVSEK